MTKFFLVFGFLLSSTFANQAFASVAGVHQLQFAQNQLVAKVSFESEPQVSKDAPMRVEFFDASTGLPVDLMQQLKVSLWMPDMGHGSGPTQLQRVLDSDGKVVLGAYRVVSVFFTMNGAWEVRVQLKDAQGKTEIQSFAIVIP